MWTEVLLIFIIICTIYRHWVSYILNFICVFNYRYYYTYIINNYKYTYIMQIDE